MLFYRSEFPRGESKKLLESLIKLIYKNQTLCTVLRIIELYDELITNMRFQHKLQLLKWENSRKKLTENSD